MKYVLAPLAIAICLGAGWFVFQQSVRQARVDKGVAPIRLPAVEVVPVETREVEDRVQLVGSLEARADVQVRSRVRGYITALPFDVGDLIERKGDTSGLPVLVQLDSATHEEQVRWSEAALRVAEARLEARKAALVLARQRVERQRRLERSGAGTMQDQEEALAELAIAQSEFDLQEATVAQARSDLQRSRLALDDTRITAPVDGYVAERFVEVGDLANPDDVLLRLVDLSVVRTVVHVVEKDYPKVVPGLKAVVRVDAFAGEDFHGSVVRKAPVLDLATRTAAVQIEIENPYGKLKPGMYARVSLTVAQRRPAQVVPVAALMEQGSQTAVFVVEGQPPKALLRPVEVGAFDGQQVEILSSLPAGARVVTLGGHDLASGQPVLPVEAATVTASDPIASGTMTGG